MWEGAGQNWPDILIIWVQIFCAGERLLDRVGELVLSVWWTGLWSSQNSFIIIFYRFINHWSIFSFYYYSLKAISNCYGASPSCPYNLDNFKDHNCLTALLRCTDVFNS